MLEILTNPGAMTRDQWMIVGIMVLLIIGVLYFCYRTYLVILDSTKNKYKPNIGLSRMESQEKENVAPMDSGDDAGS